MSALSSNSLSSGLGGGAVCKSNDKGKYLVSMVGEETPETQSMISSDDSESVQPAAVGRSCLPDGGGGGTTMENGREYELGDGREGLLFASEKDSVISSDVGETSLRTGCYGIGSRHTSCNSLHEDDHTFAFQLHEKKPSVRTAPFTCMTLTAWCRMMWLFRMDVKWWRYKWPILFTTFICILTSVATIVEEVLVWWWPTIRGHIRPIERPVFILGHYRSGTTMLHHILASDEEQFTFTSNRHCVFPSMFVVMKAIKCLIQPIFPKRRPMDNVLLDLEEPQEDEYGTMLLTGGISPFLQFFFLQERQQKVLSRYGTFGNTVNNNEAHAEMESLLSRKQQGMGMDSFKDQSDASDQLDRDEKQWRNAWCKFLRRVFYDQKGRNRRFVLKSPSHTSRIPLLLDIFPDAQFIFVHRNPYEVFQSTAYMIPAVNSLFCLTDLPTSSEVSGYLISQYLDMHRSYFKMRSLIPQGNLVEVAYSNLISDPIFEIERIYSTLGLKPYPREKMQAYVRSQEEAFQKNAPYVDLSIESRNMLRSKWAEVIRKLGYTEQLDLIDRQLLYPNS